MRDWVPPPVWNPCRFREDRRREEKFTLVYRRGNAFPGCLSVRWRNQNVGLAPDINFYSIQDA